MSVKEIQNKQEIENRHPNQKLVDLNEFKTFSTIGAIS